MAVSLKSTGRIGRSRSKRGIQPMSEINVTPFVDVMLVLLIVFMVTAPLLTVGVPVDLPQTRARALNRDVEPLAVTIDSEGKLFLQNTPIELVELVPKLEAIAANGYDQRIFVRGDQTVSYGKVMEVMGLLNSAGFTRVGLVTQPQRPAVQ
jgi:biopolymer transport protein TolR